VLILAIDPGTTQSGWVLLDGERVVSSGVEPNEQVLHRIKASAADRLAVEMIASYGMAVGREVFATCVWVGRFQQAWRDPEAVRLVYRKDVKRHLCGGGDGEPWTKATDANVKKALIDLLGPQGTKKAPGPTYGVSSHAWAALGVAVVAGRAAA